MHHPKILKAQVPKTHQNQNDKWVMHLNCYGMVTQAKIGEEMLTDDSKSMGSLD